MERDLLERGWNKPLIQRFLGDPDEIRARNGGGEYHVFFAKRVLHGEKLKRWQVEHARIIARREARRFSAIIREVNKDYLFEIRSCGDDEDHHWSDHPVIAPYMAEANGLKQRYLLKEFGIFPSIFAINREAKRERNAARKAWSIGERADAGGHAERKDTLYDLKSQALEWLVREGKVTVVGWHSFNDQIAEILCGGGYRFHRPARQAFGPAVPLGEIEAKPREEQEVPALLAESAVRGFLQDRDRLNVYEWPKRKSAGRYWRDDDYNNDPDEGF